MNFPWINNVREYIFNDEHGRYLKNYLSKHIFYLNKYFNLNTYFTRT